MSLKFFLITTLFAVPPLLGKTFAQAPGQLTLVYDITIKKNKSGGGIEETYNGGTRTVFISNKRARIRLVSLMRIQSVFFDFNEIQERQIVLVKESGTKKYLYQISTKQWKEINSKYVGSSSKLLNDSLNLGGYKCRKAIISLASGRKITAYYTSSFTAGQQATLIEPLFNCIPGTVLQYEVASGTGSVIFKISEVNLQHIAPDVFVLPQKNIEIRKFTTKEAAADL